MNSSVGGCGGGEVEGVRSGILVIMSNRKIRLGLPAVGAACFLGSVCYSARVDIVVKVGVGIQHSLPFGRLWTGGLERGCCSIF